jgi:hypothetical protein
MNMGGLWAYHFPLDALLAWFGNASANPATAVPDDFIPLLLADGDDPAVIKKQYKRLARQWHPDVCREANAGDIFVALQAAYNKVATPAALARYKLAQAWLGDAPANPKDDPYNGPADEWGVLWYPPLRCGVLQVTGVAHLNGLVVKQILAWDDVTDAEGAVMVSSWPVGAQGPVIEWVKK